MDINIYNFFKEVLGLENEELLNEVTSLSIVRHVKKGEYPVRSGEPLNYILFLYSDGIIRNFITSPDGKEMTDSFLTKRGQSLLPYINSENISESFTLEALTDIDVLKISSVEIFRLRKKYPELLQLEVRLAFTFVNIQWQLKRIHYQYSAIERYHWFLHHYPGLIDQIHNKYIASFLDMSPVTLSRIRRKVREEAEKIRNKKRRII